MPNALSAVAACLLLLPVEAALLPLFGALPAGALATARADVPLAAVLWLAVGPAGVIEGAIGAFACGTIADFLYWVHPGLFTLLAMVLFVLARVGASALDVRGAASFAALCALGSLVEALFARILLYAVGRPEPPVVWGGVLWGAALTAAAGGPLFLLLGRVSLALRREERPLGAGAALLRAPEGRRRRPGRGNRRRR